MISGCGGGSGGSTSDATNAPPAQSNSISGVASKAPINGGTVNAYKITNNTKGDLIVSSTTDADGGYSLNLGTYSGPVLLETSGGSYTDEATGNSTSIPANAPMHAVIPNASGVKNVAITPFTELAYQLAGSSLTATAITSANKIVSDQFKVYDIISVQPVQPSSAALAALPNTIQGSDQKDYTLALATFSQLASSQGGVSTAVTYLKNNISGSTLNATAVSLFQSAATVFFVNNANNKTGITDTASTNIAKIGARKAIIKLSTTGTLPSANSIKGIAFDLTLPSGVSVQYDSNGILSSYLLKSGMATNSILGSNFKNNTITLNLTDSIGISVGEFATLTCDVAYNATVPTANNFLVSPGSKVTDWKLNSGTQTLSGITISVGAVSIQ